MSKIDWLWTGWLAFFLVFEIRAATNRVKGDTFSEYVWRRTKSNPAKFTMAGFLVWLLLHLTWHLV